MIGRDWMINGARRAVEFPPHFRLLDVLRESLELTGTKEGCGEGECGACSVIVNGRLVLGCLTLAATVPDGARILTIEGLEEIPLGRRLQEAFLQGHAVQCGFCTPGMLLAAYAHLADGGALEAAALKTALSGNLCRCTGYQMILEAVEQAAPGKANPR